MPSSFGEALLGLGGQDKETRRVKVNCCGATFTPERLVALVEGSNEEAQCPECSSLLDLYTLRHRFNLHDPAFAALQKKLTYFDWVLDQQPHLIGTRTYAGWSDWGYALLTEADPNSKKALYLKPGAYPLVMGLLTRCKLETLPDYSARVLTQLRTPTIQAVLFKIFEIDPKAFTQLFINAFDGLAEKLEALNTDLGTSLIEVFYRVNPFCLKYLFYYSLEDINAALAKPNHLALLQRTTETLGDAVASDLFKWDPEQSWAWRFKKFSATDFKKTNLTWASRYFFSLPESHVDLLQSPQAKTLLDTLNHYEFVCKNLVFYADTTKLERLIKLMAPETLPSFKNLCFLSPSFVNDCLGKKSEKFEWLVELCQPQYAQAISLLAKIHAQTPEVNFSLHDLLRNLSLEMLRSALSSPPASPAPLPDHYDHPEAYEALIQICDEQLEAAKANHASETLVNYLTRFKKHIAHAQHPIRLLRDYNQTLESDIHAYTDCFPSSGKHPLLERSPYPRAHLENFHEKVNALLTETQANDHPLTFVQKKTF